MAIAANFRKFPLAMALQLVLPFGKPVWNTKRPTTRRARAFRAYITKQMAELGLRREIVKQPVPQWWKDAQRRTRAFTKKAKEAVIALDFRQELPKEKRAGMNAYRAMIWQNRVNAGTAAWA